MNIVGGIVRTSFYSLLASNCRSAPITANKNRVLCVFKSTKPITGAVGNDETIKKTKTTPKITLVGPDQSVSIVNLDEAQKISKRRDLKLVKIIDVDLKTLRPVYKLMTSAEYLEEDLKRREEKKRSKQEAVIKGDKLLSISARITEHDLLSKIHNVQKWLNKQYEVRVVVAGDGDKSKQEAIADTFEKHTKDGGRIVQKRFKDSTLRFQILPINIHTNQAAPTPVQSAATVPANPSKNAAQGEKYPNPGKHQSVRAFHSGTFMLIA
ncbi:translation initiation factor IF-3 [Armigeres subalbatus]|uniref:translation initiation factor IF-3 n=1 Tax=Armigeres subalbatus TaxID=124917 RepID=UPI002ED3D837